VSAAVREAVKQMRGDTGSFAAALFAVALLSPTGCGGTEDEEAGPGVPRRETVEVAMTEYEFSPSDPSVERGTAITVTNDGAIAHNLTIERGPDPTQRSERLAGTSTFGPGQSENLRVDLKTGKYSLVCTVPGHRQLGMVGTMTVR
jgi:plastocyanin